MLNLCRLATVCCVLFAFSGPAGAQGQSLNQLDRAKIQRVISSQISALEREDGLVAFSYATPAARRYFGSPQAFMEMVKDGYEALYRNRSTDFLEPTVLGATVIQPLRIVTLDGSVVVALYTLQQQPDNEWRISGCELADSTVQAA